MSDMTPELAREVQLRILKHGVHNDDIEEKRRSLDTLAADILEYRIEHQCIENGVWHPLTQWSPEWPLNDGYSVAPDERIVCRRVSHPWEAPMADLPMTPERAQECLEAWGDSLGEVTFNDIRSAFRTLAAMRVEHDHGVVDWEQVDGRYEKFHRVRLVSDWRDATPTEAAD